MQQGPDTQISTSDNNAPTPQRAIHFTLCLQLREGVGDALPLLEIRVCKMA